MTPEKTRGFLEIREGIMNQRRKAVLMTVIAAIMWSSAGVFVKTVSMDTLAFVGGRGLIAGIVMLPMVLGAKPKFSWALVGGSIAYAAFTFCFIFATHLTTSANAVLLQYTSPIFVAVLSWAILKEKLTKQDKICIVVSAVGMALFFCDNFGASSVWGNLVGIGSAITFSFTIIFLRLQKNSNPVYNVCFGSLIAGVIGLPALLSSGIIMEGGSALTGLLTTGLISGISYALYAKSTAHLTAIESSLLPILDPILNPVWVFLVVGERPGMLSFLGGVIVLAAVVLRVLPLILSGKETVSQEAALQ